MKKTIAVTGTPGTGKTTIAKELSVVLGYKYLDIDKVIAGHDLSEGYDKERQCSIVDTAKLIPVLEKIIRHSTKDIVVDGHLSHFLPRDYVALCIVAKCNLKILKKRLEKLYPEKKIKENLDAEIFDICFEEAKEQGHKIIIVDTSNKPVNEIIEKIRAKIAI